ncbi:dimethylmenaquinone methyltransferase [Lichenibacterium dinghuense]|uniref:dimethylmenaquinone methyltransferase n=1 Tax=Lichenibacterium dinghuense TaxID=2895977 RepID=UPI001F2053C4|nr:dimethylmenaquinone methyltransferase [Lichenibacterium sp. 6Y81]
MKITQLTHHDLDGYGASTVAASRAAIGRLVHVARYSDVGPVVAAELKRLGGAAEPEMLLMTDLGLEPVAVSFIKDFVAMNAKRPPERRHRLVVLDHHASSLDRLSEGGLVQADADPASPWPSLKSIATGDPAVTVLIDDTRCATRLARDHADLYAAHDADPALADAMAVLVEAVDAVDLWQKDRPLFRQAQVLDEVFWDNVTGFVPLGHPWHDRFIGDLLLGMAARLGGGATPAAIERDAGSLRARIVDAALSGRPGDDPEATTRTRIASLLAVSPELFRRLPGGAKLSFGLDAGTFQRVSDVVMTSGDASLVINVGRAGTMSFRSNDGTALDAARKFRGGGHRDAAGGRLTSGAVASLEDAVAQVVPLLDPPKPDPASSPFAALRGLKL